MDPNIAVKNIMTRELKTVLPETPYDEVKRIFEQNDFHHLLVVNTEGKLTGIIGQEDLLENRREALSATSGQTWTTKYYKALKAGDIMTPFPIVLDPDDTIGLAADIFLANRFHALPVVEDDDLLGIVTDHDLLKYAYQDT